MILAEVYIVIAILFWLYLMTASNTVADRVLFTLAAILWPVFSVLFLIGLTTDAGSR